MIKHLRIFILFTALSSTIPLIADKIERDFTFTSDTAWFGSRVGLKAPQTLPDSAYSYHRPMQKKPFRAAFQTAFINAGVWAFDRYILDEHFAYISINTIKDNIKQGFVWDNDKFSTNLFAHPYHGGLYFNAARANGMSFWESVPYAAAGSLMWEFMAEREPAALNDWIATTVGGVALGEVTNRISLIALDDSEQGTARIGREVLGFIASPIRGLNRLISGDMWRVKHSHYKHHNFRQTPISLSVGLGNRYLSDANHFFFGEHTPFLHIDLTYGNPFSSFCSKPFDYFTFSLTSSLSGNQPLISEVNLMAQLYKYDVELDGDNEMLVGLYQHFNYFDSEPVINGETNTPFKISEAASLGPGAIFRFQPQQSFVKIEQRLYSNLIILGGSLSDYYSVIDRNYNMGSGYSLQSHTHLNIADRINLQFSAYRYHIFTWKGYSQNQMAATNPLYLNAQGDKGNARLDLLRAKLSVPLSKALHIGIDANYYLRNTHYSQYEDVTYRTFDTRIGLYVNL